MRRICDPEFVTLGTPASRKLAGRLDVAADRNVGAAGRDITLFSGAGIHYFPRTTGNAVPSVWQVCPSECNS